MFSYHCRSEKLSDKWLTRFKSKIHRDPFTAEMHKRIEDVIDHVQTALRLHGHERMPVEKYKWSRAYKEPPPPPQTLNDQEDGAAEEEEGEAYKRLPARICST